MVDAVDLGSTGVTHAGSNPVPPTKKNKRGVYMFRGPVTETKFYGGIADNVFQNIVGDSFRGDVSFISTVRALVSRRSNGDRVSVHFSTNDYNKDTVAQHQPGTILGAYNCSRHRSKAGAIVVQSIQGSKEDVDANFQIIRENLCSMWVGFKPLDKIEAFYRKSFAVLCYVNEDTKTVLLFVDNINMAKLHFLQVSILAFLPWYFNKEDGVTDDEMNLVYSLSKNDKSEYIRCLDKLAESFDFRSEGIRQMLSGFESKFEEEELRRVKEKISENDREIKDLDAHIGRILKEREENCIRLIGLETKIASGEESSELMEYFIANRKLRLASVDGTQVQFYVNGYLEFFDSDMAESMISNRHGYVYRNGEYDTDKGRDMKALMNEIFVSDTPRMKIRTCAAYRLDIHGGVDGLSDYRFDVSDRDRLPNPHINRYSCLGNYVRVIRTRLSERDYIGAIEQCVASCASLNFGDSTVMEHFMRSMWESMNGNGRKFIELQDGSVLSVREACDWLKSEVGAGEEEGKEMEEA